jgi:hypothetical protein
LILVMSVLSCFSTRRWSVAIHGSVLVLFHEVVLPGNEEGGQKKLIGKRGVGRNNCLAKS